MRSRQSIPRRDRTPPAAVDRREPWTPPTVAARSVFSPFECGARQGPHGALARGRQSHDALRDFCRHVRPIFERLVGEGLIGAWGLTGIGHPDTIIKLLGERPAPAAVQCIANLLDSPGAMKFFDGPAKPRAVMMAARANGVGVMGIRAVQAGALTSSIDRPLPPDHPEMRDYARAAGFRRLADEFGATPAALAHRYALSLDIDTLVLGVKNRKELAECLAAADAGLLPRELMARVDQTVPRGENV